ncbi:hypothetical protein KJ603_00170, partial [Patescibacteria group bacterium]|nr:hypothetical protein [Patescibacteria group bacterium]
MGKEISPTKAYLLGLITGRGHFFKESAVIAIEFSHSNEFISGIAHCDNCGWLATKSKDDLKCKNPKCGKIVNPSVKTIYNQTKSTIESLKNEIIPFLQSEIKAEFEITGNKSMTILVIDFKKNKILFDEIASYFNSDTSFDRFHIPKEIFKAEKKSKIEFINGLLDTSGFANAGGWIPRNGKNGCTRMRLYFQIVRNWHLPVEIDNFLRSEFNLPVQTIDWGHPNIRDGGLHDFYNTNPTSWGREHQIKLFPEYYQEFKFRINSKQSMFNELIDHNVKVEFDNVESWFPPSQITVGKLKAYHPGENDLRIPEPARKHFDTFWQINLAMGCKYLKELQSNSKNPELFAITGISDSGEDIFKVEKKFDLIRNKLRLIADNEEKPKKSTPIKTKMKKGVSEQSLYAPLVAFFPNYLLEKYNSKAEAFDTSSGNLNLFLKNKNEDLLNAFDYCDKYRIKPDVVGFLEKEKELAFIEAKITSLDLNFQRMCQRLLLLSYISLINNLGKT